MLEKKRTLQWESLVSGDTALAMAKNIEAMFGADEMGNVQGASAAAAEKKAKLPKTKLFNPRAYSQLRGGKAAEWAKLFREFHSQLQAKDPLLPK